MSMQLIPRPEHPRPQFVRENWMNLNGEWDFLFDFGNSGVERELYRTERFTNAEPRKIIVPFCPESRLSGIGYVDWMAAVWYHRSVSISCEQFAGRVILHFGAVDYHSILWINERKVGEHRGGYSSFEYDVTEFLHEGENDIVLYAEDDNRSKHQPFGKQSNKFYSHACSYTRTTGIWQTVWMEFVPKNYIRYAKITPFVQDGRAMVDIEAVGGREVKAVAYFEGCAVSEASAKVAGGNASVILEIPEPHLWDVGVPNLYDLTLTLDGEDTVQSYFGMRSVELKTDGIYLNGKPLYMRTILDQGFNPEGIYTAPSDEFLKHDIELTMDLGFNGARFHQRVFEERSLYWADKLGYIVWGEYANGNVMNDARGIGYFLPEWMETVRRDYSHPSIIGWCPENESYWVHDIHEICQTTYYHVTKQMDPYRPVIDASGGVHFISDMYDIHDYTQDPARLQEKLAPMIDDPNYVHNPIHQEQLKMNRFYGQPVWVSEYGGTYWNPDEPGGWGYGNAPKSEAEFAERYAGLTKVLLDHPRICGFCYTQLTDIEQEQNGLYKYDRTRKFADEVYDRIREANVQLSYFEQHPKEGI